MKAKELLLQENKKALQYLHRAHGFDFNAPHFIGTIPGRFTYKTVSDMIRANVDGDYIATLLVKPAKSYAFNRLHHVTLNRGKFEIENRRGVPYYRFDIDHFFGVGDFEDARKHKTERVFIIAQKKEYLTVSRLTTPIENGRRYHVQPDGIRRSGDGRGNTWISEITLQPLDGFRDPVSFKPWSSFYTSEKKSDNVNDYIDKSGYISRYLKLELRRKAITLKEKHDKEALAAYDWSEREKTLENGVAAVREYLAKALQDAETWDDGRKLDAAVAQFTYLLHDRDMIRSATFRNIQSKNNRFDETERRINEILNGGKTE